MYLLEDSYMMELEKHSELLEKELEGFSEKLAQMKEEGNEDMKTWVWFWKLI